MYIKDRQATLYVLCVWRVEQSIFEGIYVNVSSLVEYVYVMSYIYYQRVSEYSLVLYLH